MSPRDSELHDASARRLAQIEFDRPVAVEAGAGTGKTTVLVARTLGWCLGRGWIEARSQRFEAGDGDPTVDEIAGQVLDGLVAITFTEAAAAQMARRVGEALAALARDPRAEVVGFQPDLLPAESHERIRERSRALIGALDHLAIRTIHSHCFSLLATYPMAAGLALDLRVDADGRELDEIVHDVVEDAVKRAYPGADDEPLRRLALAGIDPQRVAAAVHALATEGLDAAAFLEDPYGSPSRRLLRRRLLAAVGDLATLAGPIGEQKRAPTDREVAEAIQETRSRIEQTPDPPARIDLALLLEGLRDLWTDRAVARLREWARGKLNASVARVVGTDSGRLTRLAAEWLRLLTLYRRVDLELFEAGRQALAPLLTAVETELRRRGVLTFSSLMTEAWRLLDSHPQVLRRERRKLRQLLVDEFQDTDALQCDLVRLLALGGDREDRPGLFVVGDPKQSIYGWRDADLQAYDDFLEDLRGAGGVKVELDQNFRSVPAVLQEVDRAIAPVMRPLRGLQPRFAPLVAWERLTDDPGFDRAGRAAIEYWVSRSNDEAKFSAEEAARLEAKAIAADIRDLHDQEAVSWQEFGLLLRSTSRVETYLEAFRRVGVPFVVTSDKHYFRRREIIDAAALIRTIVLPVDHLALVTFLRSPTVGVPDAALLPLWRRHFPELATRLGSGDDDGDLDTLRTMLATVAAELPADLPGLDRIEDWHLSAIAGLESLAALRRAFDTEPADRFTRRLRERFLLDVTESARYLGLYRQANLDRFFRQLESALEERAGDAQAVLRALRKSVAEAEEADQALPEGAVEDAVQVMTIHGAKGLEFGHVYLPQLHARGGRDEIPDNRADRSRFPRQQARYILFGNPTPGWEEVEGRRSMVEWTERVRTLYVAMTRAKSRLVMIGSWPDTPQPVSEPDCKTYLDLLSNRSDLPASIAELMASCVASETSWRDVGGVRWRFPALESRWLDERSGRRDLPAFPSRQELKRQEAVLTRRRVEARARMNRRFSAAASAAAAERLEWLLTQEGDADPPATRPIAQRVGDAFHRLIETWDLNAPDPTAELARLEAAQNERILASTPAPHNETTLERFGELMARFRQGQFLDRLLSVADSSPAREVPVLLAPSDRDQDAVGFVAGFIDLLYRDTETDEWVVVDYKTDRIEDRAEIAARTEAYALQESVYTRAIQQALELDSPPRAELWFIWPDELWEDSTDR